MGIKSFLSRPALTSSTALAGATFRGLSAAAKAEEDDDTDMKGGEKPESGEKKTTKKPKEKSKGKGKAEDGEDDEEDEDEDDKEKKDDDGEDDDEDEDGEDARAEDGDDGSDESDMRRGKKNAVVRSARMRERRRIAHIMESAAAANNHLAALSVALNMDVGREKAVAFLETMPPLTAAHAEAPEATLKSRMEQLDGKNAGRDAPASLRGKGAVDKVWADAIGKHAITAKKPA
jgi:hypothetical protein